MAGLAPGGIFWLYSPLLMVLPIVIAGHLVGVFAAHRSAGTGSARKLFPLVRHSSFASHRLGPFAIRTSRLSGVSVLLLPNFLGGFLGASWVLVILLFSAIGTNPFVYFQF
jgi:hypothetical protein